MLTDEIHGEIKRLCAVGDQQAKRAEFGLALTAYREAFDRGPDPKTDWDASTWILAAIGDANFLGHDFAAGRDNLSLRCGVRMRLETRFSTFDLGGVSLSSMHRTEPPMN
ncbi:hypothetical protein J2W30_006891 [Variovorax boronicumulans]|uniref:hypothetical protein n=1 Tax=Variovorax boronicumulans TaxID=436515 RepID=UPI002784ED89|nr:hypothetical protein [Variovorax boronicumulans]MDQ0039098.1 hypothetical protein [Variovorax boronicumulans]